jgi:hypothetical protein
MSRRGNRRKNARTRAEKMTELSESMKDKICIYCENNKCGCKANVPYYAVSIFCKFFMEKGAEPVMKKKHGRSIEWIKMKTLVETF